MRDRPAVAEHIAVHRGNCDRPVGVMHVVDVRDIRDVPYVGHIANIRDVHNAEVVSTEVIPGKEWLTGSQRKPAHQSPNADADGEARTSKKCKESRRIDRKWNEQNPQGSSSTQVQPHGPTQTQ